MKHFLFLIFVIAFSFTGRISYCNESDANGDTVNIATSPEMYDITVRWVKGFEKLNPDINFKVNTLSDARILAGESLGFVSDEAIGSASWNMIIGHDIIVPVINATNPMIEEINRQGISPSEFTNILSSTSPASWSTILKNGKDSKTNLYVIDNVSVINRLGAFTKTDPALINATRIATIEELIQEVEKDPLAIAFCHLADIRKNDSNEIMGTLRILPIDKNENGLIDNFENIYKGPDELSHGAWIGKYPKSLCGSIYAISTEKPVNKITISFLSWILSDGGAVFNTTGYSELASIEKTSAINALQSSDLSAVDDDKPARSGIGVWILSFSILILLASIIIFGFSHEEVTDKSAAPKLRALTEDMIDAPKGVFFDKSHTWVFMEKDGAVRVGIDDFIQHVTGTITRVKMKESGDTVKKGEKIMTIIRDGKQLEICSPVSGTIREKNRLLHNNATILNSSPYNDGWVYKIEPKNWLRETEFLFMSEKYSEWIKNEFTRLKDFFAVTLNPKAPLYSHVLLQDGGQLCDNALADLDPKVWEDFQTNFIDTSR